MGTPRIRTNPEKPGGFLQEVFAGNPAEPQPLNEPMIPAFSFTT
jgi:hypothetical protein